MLIFVQKSGTFRKLRAFLAQKLITQSGKQGKFNGQGTAAYDNVIRVNKPNYTGRINLDIYHWNFTVQHEIKKEKFTHNESVNVAL